MIGVMTIPSQTNFYLFFVLFWCVIFQVKHLAADYFWQTDWMLNKFKGGIGWILPLMSHCFVHAALTGVLAVVFFGPSKAYVAIIDFVLHFAMDRIKASPNMLGRFKPLYGADWLACKENLKHSLAEPKAASQKKLDSNKWFWRSLGIDQFVHHITHYYILYLMLS